MPYRLRLHLGGEGLVNTVVEAPMKGKAGPEGERRFAFYHRGQRREVTAWPAAFLKKAKRTGPSFEKFEPNPQAPPEKTGEQAPAKTGEQVADPT